MKQPLRENSLLVSRIITGAWRWTLSSKDVLKLVETSVDAGMTTFDHADIYGDYENEKIFGNALREHSSLRTEIQLVTKCGIKLISTKFPERKVKYYDTSKEHIINSATRSLELLRTDYIDLLLLHRPDPLLDPHEVASAFDQLKKEGKVLHFGVSNFSPHQVELLEKYTSVPLVTNQIELSLFRHQSFFNGDVDFLVKSGITPMAWSPLGGGKHFDDSKVMEKVNQMAEAYNATPSNLLLAWLLKHPAGIFPVIGTTRAERIRESAKAMDVNLSREHWFELLEVAAGHEVA